MKSSAKCLRCGSIRRGRRRRGCPERRVGRSNGWPTRRDAEGERFCGAPMLLLLLAPAARRGRRAAVLCGWRRALRTARAVPPGLAPSLPRDVVLAGGPAEVTAPACAPVARNYSAGCSGSRSRQRRRRRRPHAPPRPLHLFLAVSALLPRLDTLEVSAHIRCCVRGGSASHPAHASRSGNLLSAALPRGWVRFCPCSRRDLCNRFDLFLWRRGISAFPSALVQLNWLHKRPCPVATLCCRI